MASGKKEQIMQAAERLFTSRRMHEITLDEVAELASVGKGTIYRYFKDKDDLFFEVATAGFDDLCEVVRRSAPSEGDFAQSLRAACSQIAAFFDRRRQLFNMMQAEENRMHFYRGALRERWLLHRRKLVEAVGQIIAKGVREGQVRSDWPAEVLANYLLGMLRTTARDLPDLKPRAPEVVVDLFLRGARADGGKSPTNAPDSST
jgi:AcrR family transcriptional regulator